MKLTPPIQRWSLLGLMTLLILLKINWLGMAALTGFVLAYLGKGLRKNISSPTFSKKLQKKLPDATQEAGGSKNQEHLNKFQD